MSHSEIELDIEYETPSGKVWEFIAKGVVCAAEPDVGINSPYIDEYSLYWNSGKEFSKSAYATASRFPCLHDHIEMVLLEAT